MKDLLYSGAAKVNITPTDDLFPLKRENFYSIGGAPEGFGGVIDPIFVRAIAFACGDKKALIVVFDLGGTPDPEHNVARLSKHTGIPEENILFTATHTHAAPMCFKIENPKNSYEEKVNRVYELVSTAMMEAVYTAIASMQPAVIGFGCGASDININRNQDIPVGGKVTSVLGINGFAPCERTLDVIEVKGKDEKPIAFLINYPMHATVMHMNSCFGDMMGITGDIPGRTSDYVEKKYEGAVALWTSGAAGNQNPIAMNATCTYDPIDGHPEYITSGNLGHLSMLSAHHAADVFKVIDSINQYRDSAIIGGAVEIIRTPGIDYIHEVPGNRFSKVIGINQDGQDYCIRTQLLRIGNIAFIGVGGELFNSIGRHLMDISPLKQTMVVTHNVSVTGAGYILDDDGLTRKPLAENLPVRKSVTQSPQWKKRCLRCLIS
jgi:neutral ceramidase